MKALKQFFEDVHRIADSLANISVWAVNRTCDDAEEREALIKAQAQPVEDNRQPENKPITVVRRKRSRTINYRALGLFNVFEEIKERPQRWTMCNAVKDICKKFLIHYETGKKGNYPIYVKEKHLDVIRQNIKNY